MQKVKLFIGSATGDALPELEQEINKWIEKSKILKLLKNQTKLTNFL